MSKFLNTMIADMDATYNFPFVFPILGIDTNVHLTVRGSYLTEMTFTLHGMPYTFRITKWSSRGYAKLESLFFRYTSRDSSIFGVATEDQVGRMIVDSTPAQRVNIVVQAAKDVLTCINQIGARHRRSLVEYAIWFREHFQNMDTYELYITRIACHCLVHEDFLAPDVTWDLVLFNGVAYSG